MSEHPARVSTPACHGAVAVERCSIMKHMTAAPEPSLQYQQTQQKPGQATLRRVWLHFLFHVATMVTAL